LLLCTWQIAESRNGIEEKLLIYEIFYLNLYAVLSYY
jgi:hypothetical protein